MGIIIMTGSFLVLARLVGAKSTSTSILGRSVRLYSSMTSQGHGLVLGVYQGEKDGEVAFTKATQDFVNAKASRLPELLQISGLAAKAKKGQCQLFHGLDAEYSSVGVVSLGKQGVGYNALEEVEEGRENVRTAVAGAIKKLAETGVKSIHIDPCGDAEAAAEAATLCMDVYDDLKSEDKKKPKPAMQCVDSAADVAAAWQRGVVLGEGQNFARRLMEAPANVMTPTRFSELATEYLGKCANTTVNIHDKAWAEEKKMGCFLSVAQGSWEPLKFVHVVYNGAGNDSPPYAMVGKGITFDSGGISIKPSANMDAMRADMGGAACVLASIYTAARLQLPINLMAFIPCTENMPALRATKPGDVFTSMSGKTVQVDNTDAEGRLVLCDALCYAQTFNPRGILDMATLTGAMVVALGSACTGVFTNNTESFSLLHKAGTVTGDRVWRMPLFQHYKKQMTDCVLADVNNLGSAGREGGSCTAAGYLWEFVNHDNWMHLDIAGVMSNKAEVPYVPKGMSGRPTRTIVEFLNLMSKQ